MSINMDAMTLEDFIDMYKFNKAGVVLGDGKVMGFQDDNGNPVHCQNWGSGRE